MSSQIDVEVTVAVYGCEFNLKTYPEIRTAINWDTLLNVEIYDSVDVYKGTFQIPSNNNGDATINLCDNGIFLLNGTYDFYIKGFSHLRKKFDNYGGFSTASSTIDFTAFGELLIAGETSNVYNNVINTLDISTQMVDIGTSDVKNDLNQDGIVNMLDINHTISKYLVEGDCSPQEISNDICD